jgi:hypothetical protein
LDQGDRLRHPGVDFGALGSDHLEAVGNVLGHGHVGEHGIGLEHHVHRPAVRLDIEHVLAVDQDRAVAGRLEAGDHAQQRRLAAARRPEQGEELAGANVEAHIVDRDDGRAEALGDFLNGDDGIAAVHVHMITPCLRAIEWRVR